MYVDNHLLFPHQTIPLIRNSRGENWQNLIDQVSPLPEDHPESLAFSLAMIRLNGCIECETDSYRAMRGCTACAQQVLRRHKGPDSEILEMYDEALEDIRLHLATTPLEISEEREVSQKRAA